VIYVLDTDICSYLMKRTHPVLIEDATLVTNNLREFSRVSGLRLEDWVRSGS
jgi:predicted nucleic acid-binding protein